MLRSALFRGNPPNKREACVGGRNRGHFWAQQEKDHRELGEAKWY